MSREKYHGNVSTKMAGESRVYRFSSSCFHLLFYELVFTLTNSSDYASYPTSNVTLLGGSNVTNNGTDDYTLTESTTQSSDYNSTVQPTLISGPLPLSGRLPTTALNGKTSLRRT